MPGFDAAVNSTFFRAGLAAFVLWSFNIYKKMNETADGGDVLMTRLDRAIPFLPVFSVPYLMYLPYLFWLVIYGIVESPYFAQIAASILAVQLGGAFVYWMHQTHVPRPVVTGKDVFSRLTAFIYSHDRPYCNYPSFHVAYAVLCGYWSVVLFPGAAAAVAVFTLAIIASTLFLKQHAIIDVFGGVTLAALCLMLLR